MSFFDDLGLGPYFSKHQAAAKPSLDLKTPTKNQLEGWIHRLRQAADEAGDHDLVALESDLLDIRDEIYNLI